MVVKPSHCSTGSLAACAPVTTARCTARTQALQQRPRGRSRARAGTARRSRSGDDTARPVASLSLAFFWRGRILESLAASLCLRPRVVGVTSWERGDGGGVGSGEGRRAEGYMQPAHVTIDLLFIVFLSLPLCLSPPVSLIPRLLCIIISAYLAIFSPLPPCSGCYKDAVTPRYVECDRNPHLVPV